MTPANPVPQGTATMTRGMVLLFAFCCGAIVANIYYAQPIIGLIAPDIGLTSTMASLIVSLTQIGYALGLFFLVPLGDLLENRRLMIITTLVAIASLLGAAFTDQPNVFLLISLLVGFSSVSVQILIPPRRTPGPGGIPWARGRRDHGRFVAGDLVGTAGLQCDRGPLRLACDVRDCRGVDGCNQRRIGPDNSQAQA